LHFVHHRSPQPGAIPLLFIHGWPGSFLEVQPLLPHLTNSRESTADSSSSATPAFHVIAPSLPGFGFSPSPTSPFGYIEAAHALHALMIQLGYNRYVIQGGDAGGLILRYQCHLYPTNVVSAHSNFWVVSPSHNDRARYIANEASADEVAIIERLDGFFAQAWGYGQIQQTRPLRLAHGLGDSPVGLAMWVYDALWPSMWDLANLTPSVLVTWTMMLWIPGPYAGFALYKAGAQVCCWPLCTESSPHFDSC
jgi:pimeloyl-ACP methyl ester carboxylesterase